MQLRFVPFPDTALSISLLVSKEDAVQGTMSALIAARDSTAASASDA